ncbi:MAG: Lipoprotein [Parcubacteria group bacterium GW2011_GWB1_40_14]|nr:MAG: Lipoprotein [Parcubacteria group bacterium GW2011_GWB1_40_14]
MNLTPEQEEISSSRENPYSKKNAIGLGKKWFSWFYKRSSGGVLASLIFLGVAGGSSMSLESQGFLFAVDSTAGGSYVEEVYVDALVDNYNEAIPFVSSQGILPEEFGVLEFLELEDEDFSKNFISGHLSPTNFLNVGGANRRTVVQHTVKEGETMSFIAASYGVNVDTIQWANKVSNPDLLSPGTVLDILPASGVAHIVKSGDTIDSIAKKYRADSTSIIAFNALPADGQVKTGEFIIVPGGSIAPPPPPPAAPRSTASSFAQNISTSGYFIAPTTGRNFGRRHANNGVDIANSCGTSIYAAADGTVTKVYLTEDKTRRAGGGYGNNIIVKHQNGTETLYAHILKGTVSVSLGEAVAKGQQVASIGGKPGTPGAGRSTGCHLHFEVHGGSNPFLRR